MKFCAFFLIGFLIIFSSSCRNETKEKENFEPVFSTYRNDSTGAAVPAAKNEIFYGILTPVEISRIFNRLGIAYSEAIVNPISNKDLYLSNAKAAINTGIYGVDLGYVKIFGVGQGMIDYMVTIREMSNKLGIPDHFLTEPIKKLQSDSTEPDSIMNMMNDAFNNMENHLRAGGRESTAGLMVLGGWVEALYISTQLLYNPANPDPEVVQKIAEQKYTLTTLLSFLKNYFDTFDIYFKKGDLEIDNSKKVFRASGSEMNITVETLNTIRDYVAKLRTEMVTP